MFWGNLSFGGRLNKTYIGLVVLAVVNGGRSVEKSNKQRSLLTSSPRGIAGEAPQIGAQASVQSGGAGKNSHFLVCSARLYGPVCGS